MVYLSLCEAKDCGKEADRLLKDKKLIVPLCREHFMFFYATNPDEDPLILRAVD